MPAVVHVVKGPPNPLARVTIKRQLDAGDRVTLVFLAGAAAPEGLDGVIVRRVPDELTYRRLLDLLFEADQVITW